MKIPLQTDIAVVGGGPAGTTFALHAALAGLKVVVLEKDRDIGVPVRCGEAVSDAGLRIFHDPDPRWIRTTIDRIRLVSPDETVIEFPLRETGYILDRRIFDYDLAVKAAEAGALIVTKAYVNGLLTSPDGVCGVTGRQVQEPFQLRARLVVGADGVESRVGRWAGIRTQLKLKDLESGIQKTVSGIDVTPNIFEFYLSSSWAPGGYLWVFPKGKTMANIGLAINGVFARDGKAAHRFLDEFLEWKYPNGAVLSTVAGGVPVAKTVREMVTDGLMLVGDAAHTVNPLTGGGIISGMRSGLLAAETAVEILKNNLRPTRERLKAYEQKWYKIGGKNHERLYRLKEAIYRLTDQELDAIAHRLVSVPEDQLSLFKMFSTALRTKPSLLIDVARLFTGI
ncbi:MAG: NAD(P)/FAD-dependent oxidoreductase [Candidatus Neomarinimicrobiota bacterium]|nr:MAG: NAD(P)/FAD-dependent oxidoreductase [Candidatus Neomarinimicrobiota bacterium]